VIIAEDDPSIRRMLSVTLRTYGYQTVEACDGEEALHALHALVKSSLAAAAER
jgi:CheY-like chemotaxis protein